MENLIKNNPAFTKEEIEGMDDFEQAMLLDLSCDPNDPEAVKSKDGKYYNCFRLAAAYIWYTYEYDGIDDAFKEGKQQEFIDKLERESEKCSDRWDYPEGHPTYDYLRVIWESDENMMGPECDALSIQTYLKTIPITLYNEIKRLKKKYGEQRVIENLKVQQWEDDVDEKRLEADWRREMISFLQEYYEDDWREYLPTHN